MHIFHRTTLWLGLAFLGLTSCRKIEFDPNQSVDLHSEERVNFASITTLRNRPPNDPVVKIGVIGDTHLDYEETEELVAALNAVPDLDLVIHTGDLTDHGIFREFEWKVKYLKKLKVPFVAVIGNHDLVAKGKSVYTHMFGHTDFSFIYADTRFVFFDSNSREYGFSQNTPNLSWLEQQLQPDQDGLFSQVVLVSHVPYFDMDFDQSKREAYTRILKQAHRKTPILASLNGHMHNGFDVSTNECPIPHLGPGSARKRGFFILEIENGTVRYEKHQL